MHVKAICVNPPHPPVWIWIQSAKLGESVNEGTVVQTGTFGYLLWWRVKVHAARPERANKG